MTDEITLIKANPLMPVEDFNFLKQAGIGHIEKLGSDIWTEYNTSDPGITILEAVSYAITDLAYRTGFEMKDLLTPAKLSDEMWKNIFYTARQILHNNPLTISDFRKKIIDIDGVRNAWLEISKDYEVPIYVDYQYVHTAEEKDCGCHDKPVCKGKLSLSPSKGINNNEIKQKIEELLKLINEFSKAQVEAKAKGDTATVAKLEAEINATKTKIEALEKSVGENREKPSKILEINGLYNVLVEYEEDILEEKRRDDIRENVYKIIHENRNLCEDFLSVNAVDFDNFTAQSLIIVKENVDTDELLAQIALTIYRYFTPRIGFYTIEQMLAKGYSVEEIFEGPALNNGFIDTAELEQTELFRDLRLSDLISLIADIEGVESITNLYIPIEAVDDNDKDLSVYFNNWIKHLQEERKVAKFDLANSRFTFLKKNSVTTYNTGNPKDKPIDRAAKRFEDLKAQEQAYKLNGYQNDYPILLGENMDLENYFPVQYSLPRVYGVSEQETLPENPSDNRTIQAYQLKGYLQFFEQILANHHAQLNNLNTIFSFDDSVNQTYFVHLLSEINNLKDLILGDSPTDSAKLDEFLKDFSALVQKIIEPDKVFFQRRNTILNHLLARFDEDISEYESLTRYILPNIADQKLINDKQAILQDYQKVSAERAKGFNYLDAEEIWDTENISGAERRIGRLIGIENICRHTLAPSNLVKEPIMIKNNKGEMVQKTNPKGDKLAVIKLLDEKREPILTSNEVVDSDCCVDEFMNLILQQAESKKNFETHDQIKGINRNKYKEKTGIFTFILLDDEGYEIAHSNEYSSEINRDEAIKLIIETVNKINQNEGMHLVEHLLLRPKLDEVLPYADFTEPTDNEDVPPEKVKFLGICLDECDLNKGLDDKVDQHPYRIRLSRIPAEKCYNNEPWVLEIFNEKNESILFQKVYFDKEGTEVKTKLTFRRYEAMNQRLADLREFGSEPDNYIIEKYTTDIPDAAKKEDLKYSFKIVNEKGVVLAQSKFYDTLKEAENERDSLVKYHSFQLDLYCDAEPCDHNEDPYSFRITIVLPCWVKRFRNETYRYFVEKTIYAELPAHIHARVKWVGIGQMKTFEEKYWAWLDEFMSNQYPQYRPVNELVTLLDNLTECGNCEEECVTVEEKK
jgi:hypothetical protein